MVVQSCQHESRKKHGKDRKGHQRYRCVLCGTTWTEKPESLLGDFRVPEADAKLALRLLTEGMSIRATERTTGLHRDTIMRLMVFFGEACQRFLDKRMQGLKLDHLQFDEQWTFVAKKQSRLKVEDRGRVHDQGDLYIWTCVDQETKLMPSFTVGKRSADNARRFMADVASRLEMPRPGGADRHNYIQGVYKPIVQISTDGFPAYPEAVDLAFGQYAKFGTIIKDYRNANMIYTPSEMVGTKREGRRGIGQDEEYTICTSHVERLNGTQRVFLKRLNRLTLCFSKKLENLEAAFAMFAAYYNFCWQTREKGNSGRKRPTAAMMAGLETHVWSFNELFRAVLSQQH